MAAIILLLGFSTYFTETVELLVNRCASAATTRPCDGMKGGTCMMCHKKELPKKPTKDCTSSSVCVDCPLCYNLMPANCNSITALVIIFKKQYAAREINLVPGHISAQWKPPNAA